MLLIMNFASFFISLYFVSVFNAVRTAKILAVLPNPASSHIRVYKPLLEKLAERGHEVDVMSNYPRKTPLSGYNDLSVRGCVPLHIDIPVNEVIPLTAIQTLDLIHEKIGTTFFKLVLNTTASKDLMGSNKTYDVIIAEMFLLDWAVGYTHIFRAPLIGLSTSIGYPWIYDFVGMPDNPSYILSYFSPYAEDMDLMQRFYNAASLYLLKAWYYLYTLNEINHAVEEVFGRNKPHIGTILKNMSLLMVNSHFSMQQSRPMTSNFIEIGGIHINPNPMLLKGYEKHLNTHLWGVAFLSFGTYFKSGDFPDFYVSALFEALSKVPYKILWSGNQSDVAKHLVIPKNIHFVPWMPQLEILCHPNLKFFITHCGLASYQEAVYCGKPILAIPIWSDQRINAMTAVSKGIAVSFPLSDLTTQRLSNALRELLENPKYSSNAKILSQLFRDRPMSALDTAVYWTEYVIKHNGAPHLRSKAIDLPWYTYYCIDIIILLAAVIFALFVFLRKLLGILKVMLCAFVHHEMLIIISKSKKKIE